LGIVELTSAGPAVAGMHPGRMSSRHSRTDWVNLATATDPVTDPLTSHTSQDRVDT